MNYFTSEEANRFSQPLPSCPPLPQTLLLNNVYTFASTMQASFSFDSSLAQSAQVGFGEPMIIDDGSSYHTNHHLSFLPLTAYTTFHNSHHAEPNRQDCLPQGVDMVSEDASMFFEDRELVSQMLSSSPSSASSPSPSSPHCSESVAVGLGSTSNGDYRMSPNDARDEFGNLMDSNNSFHSSTYTDYSPVTPLNASTSSLIECQAQQLYHPQPRYFDPMFRFLDEPPSGPVQYITPLPLLDEEQDCGVHFPMSDGEQLLRSSSENMRPRVHTGLGIYQFDSVKHNRRAPVAFPDRRNLKRAREEEDDEGVEEWRSKKHRA